VRRSFIWIAVGVVGLAANIALGSALLPMLFLPAMNFLNSFPGSGGPPERIASADYTGSGSGSLVSATTMPGLTRTILGRGLIAARVLYRSTSGDTGQPTVVSGSVFIAPGTPPQGGWPVVAFGHATVGIEGPCAPSLSDNLVGSVAAAIQLTDRGYAVAIADFQGLGTKGVHPYPDSRTAGLNIIDSVRALRHTFPDVSDRWATVGNSQGAGASWASDEQAQSYAPELHLVGAVAASPPADISGYVDKAQQGTLTPDQRPIMQMIVESLARLHPDLNRDDYRRGAAAQYWNVLSACTGDAAYQRASAAKKLSPRDFTPRSPEAADRLRQLLQQWALPQKPLSAPLFVWYGGMDTYIDAPWTKAAIERACAMGGSVTVEFDPHKGHSEADIGKLLDWVDDRFAGMPAKNDC
jgi:hypothetical protein